MWTTHWRSDLQLCSIFIPAMTVKLSVWICISAWSKKRPFQGLGAGEHNQVTPRWCSFLGKGSHSSHLSSSDSRAVLLACLLYRETGCSQNHRMVWVGRDLTDIWFQPPCHGQGHLPLEQGAQSSIQPGLEHCQGGGSHNFSGQPAPVSRHASTNVKRGAGLIYRMLLVFFPEERSWMHSHF